MTGVLENMQAAIVAMQQEVAAIKQHLAAAPAAPAATPVAAANPFAATAPVAAANPFAGLGGAATPAAAAPVNVTADQIVALITPHLDNAAVKEALGAEMAAMGIPALPEAQPNQYGELYQRFANVIGRFQGAAQAAAPSSLV